MSNPLRLVLLFLLFCFSSCSRINKLSKLAKAWIPYEGHETLVFESNTGERDSIYLLGIETANTKGEQWVIQTGYEHLSVYSRQANRRPGDSLTNAVADRREGTVYSIIEINGDGGDGHINFDLLANNARFYELPSIKVHEIDDRKPGALSTRYGDFNDIYILDASPSDSAAYYELNNYVKRLYWSKSQGLVRYDKKDGEYWVLKRKYIGKIQEVKFYN